MSRKPNLVAVLMATLICLNGCSGGSSGGDSQPDVLPAPVDPAPPMNPQVLPMAGVDWNRDVLSTALDVDVSTRQVTAVVHISGAGSEAVSLEIGDLDIVEVQAEIDGQMRSLNYRVEAAALHIGVPASIAPAAVSIHYSYRNHEDFDGAMNKGLTFVWPYFCGNLFPCKSNPDDGLQFKLALSGIPAQQQAIFPDAIIADAPSYMLAWAIGDYDYIDLGSTSAGTQVGVWHSPGGKAAAVTGTSALRNVFDWLETRYGAYSFGLDVASVSAPWGEGAFGGMEHHPYWHIAAESMDDPAAHAHEAAHGWFGNGIRIACWEDFVLSEGLATYLAARAIEHVAGEIEAQAVWDNYQARLNRLQNSQGNKIAWPQSCGAVDILTDGLFGEAPYIKGAFFLLALEERIGRQALDDALALFYTRHVGQAARMQDLLNLLAGQTGYDATECAQAWLQSGALPASGACI